MHNDIEVSCLPQDLPSYIEVDLKDLEAGHSIHASELVFPAGVTPVVHGDDYVVVSIPAKKAGSGTDAAEGEGRELSAAISAMTVLPASQPAAAAASR
jgi:large subunit ribosomal protein L25